MVWASHRMVTFAALFALTRDPFIALSGLAGSTFPDHIEGPFWRNCHRTYSHWFVLYLPALVLFFPGQIHKFCYGYGTASSIQCFLFWFFVGALFHIVEDGVCGKIPVWHPTKRVMVVPRLFYTGSIGEYVFVGIFCIAMLGIVLMR